MNEEQAAADFKLMIECASHIDFHYYDSCYASIHDQKFVEYLKQHALEYIKENY